MLPSSVPGASSGLLPRPQGVLSLGSAESLREQQEKEQEERALKGAAANIGNKLKKKLKQCDDKIKELDGFMDKVRAAPGL